MIIIHLHTSVASLRLVAVPRGKSIVYFICRHKFKLLHQLQIWLCTPWLPFSPSYWLYHCCLSCCRCWLSLCLLWHSSSYSWGLTPTAVSIDLYGSLISCVCVSKVTRIMPDCTISCPNWLLNQSAPVAAAHVSLSIRWVIYKVGQIQMQRASLISTVDRTLRQCGSSSRHMWHRKAASIQGAAGCALLLSIYHLPFTTFKLFHFRPMY